MRVWPGRPYPLGATWDGAGVNFAAFSESATAAELCLFGAGGANERRVRLREYTDHVWHGYLPDARPGQLYGFRFSGPYEPEQGLRFNPHKLLFDPYARAVGRGLTWDDALFGYQIGKDDLTFDARDSGPFAPLAAVVDTAFTWGDDRRPNRPWRDAVRGFWAGEPVPVKALAHRLTGSGDLYERTGRRPYASINFVTCHDGFTLRDLVSYNEKHNEANGENNNDGHGHNRSWNCGHEGPTDDPKVLALRRRQQRNLFATLMLSQGVPMVLAGDEIGHTQLGNNNTYCQDNELTWLDWEKADRGFLDFARSVAQIWQSQPVLKRRTFFLGRAIRGEGVADVAWFGPGGGELTDAEWAEPRKCLGMRLAGDLMGETDERGEPIYGDTLFVMMNAGAKPVRFALPGTDPGQVWELMFDTADDARPTVRLAGGSGYDLAGHALAVVRTRPEPPDPGAATALHRAARGGPSE